MDHNLLDEILLDLVSNKINILDAKKLIMALNKTPGSSFSMSWTDTADEELLKHLSDYFDLSAKTSPTLPNRL